MRGYSKLVTDVEETFAMGWIKGEAWELTGEPINIHFERPINNLEEFCESVFSCSEPFKLWGTPVRVSPQMYTVAAVDLHVGNKINFEITDRFMRVYLPKGTCGNTVVRLYTNLQHHYDAMVKVRGRDGKSIFEF